jgi:hypothetical protein
MNKRTLKTAGWVWAMLALPTVSNAATIFSSLGPGGTYVCCSGLGVGAFNGGLYRDAGAFTPSYNTTLTQIDVPVFEEPGSGSFLPTGDGKSLALGANRNRRTVEARQREAGELLVDSGRHVSKHRDRRGLSQIEPFDPIRAIVNSGRVPAQRDV